MLPKSAKELSKILTEYQFNSISGGIFDLTETGKSLATAAKSDDNAPPLAKLLAALDCSGNGITSVLAYWKFRDQIRDFQVQNNISSVLWETEDWNGSIIRFPSPESQLQFMPQDLAILRRNKKRVLDQFCQFADKSGLNWVVDDEEDYCSSVPLKTLTIAEIKDMAIGFDYVTLSHWKEHPVKCGDTMKILYWEKNYSLWLCMAPNEDGTEKLVHISASVKLNMVDGDRQMYLGE